jgi:hypothetical protein
VQELAVSAVSASAKKKAGDRKRIATGSVMFSTRTSDLGVAVEEDDDGTGAPRRAGKDG